MNSILRAIANNSTPDLISEIVYILTCRRVKCLLNIRCRSISNGVNLEWEECWIGWLNECRNALAKPVNVPRVLRKNILDSRKIRDAEIGGFPCVPDTIGITQ